MSNLDRLTLEADGAQLFRGALNPSALAALEDVLAPVATDRAGVRLNGHPGLASSLAAREPIGRIAAGALGPHCFPVRAILFDKTEATNWSLGWHQDRTIAVRERRDIAGFGPWTIKQGLTHVARRRKFLRKW